MSYLQAALIIVCASLAAAVASLIVGGCFSVEQRRQRHEQVSPMVQFVGLMFSVLLAFVFSEVWGEYNVAAESISDECGALHGAAILSAALPNGSGQKLERALYVYVRAVSQDEWRDMARRERSPAATAAITTAMQDAAAVSYASPSAAATVQSQIISLLAQAHAARETRTFQMTQGLPPPMWWVLITITVALVLSASLTGMEGLAHMVFAASFAACIVMVLVLVRMFDYPFEGAMALNSDDFVKLAGQIKALTVG
jgi:hypothetical protein